MQLVEIALPNSLPLKRVAGEHNLAPTRGEVEDDNSYSIVPYIWSLSIILILVIHNYTSSLSLSFLLGLTTYLLLTLIPVGYDLPPDVVHQFLQVILGHCITLVLYLSLNILELSLRELILQLSSLLVVQENLSNAVSNILYFL